MLEVETTELAGNSAVARMAKLVEEARFGLFSSVEYGHVSEHSLAQCSGM